MLWETILIKGLHTALLLGFFTAVLVFLRFLYGPRGRFRDPQWDARSEKAPDAGEDNVLREEFTRYAASWFCGDPEADAHLALKLEHTFRVCAHAKELADSESVLADREISRALKTAALFHDVARFEQYVQYKTFADDLSFNHGVMGARTLVRHGFLRRETRSVQRLVLGAVALHNRLALPDTLPDKLRLVLLALRDADKLDILRVMEGQFKPGAADAVVLLHLRDEPGSYSPSVLSALEEGRTALYRDMRFYNDFRILLCTWLFDLHFPTTLRIVKRNGQLERIIDGLVSLPELREKMRAAARKVLGSRTNAT